jgi:hypothetical protein
MSCWRRLEKIIWTDRVRNEAVLHTVKEKRNILNAIKIRKAIWISDIFLKYIIEGQIAGTEVMGRRGRSCKLLLNGF